MQMHNKGNLETVYIREEIGKCEDVEDLKERIFPLIKTQQEQWVQKINEIITETGFSKKKFAEMCGVSRVAVNKWCNGAIPKNRETFLKIGMVAGYDLEKMNQLLQRYGQYPELYSKSLEDCVCIFVLSQNLGEETLTKYNYILKKIKDNIIRNDDSVGEDITTLNFDEKLSDVKDENELEQFIADNSATFSKAYHRFYAYVNTIINANYQRDSNSVNQMADGQEWSSSLRQCVSAIRQKKWYPTRNKIISLGLHLSMDREQIDEILELAHMEPLCAKNIFESVIIYILEDASLNEILDTDSEEFDPDELCRYARTILTELDLPEVAAFISELPEMDDDEW